VNRKTIRRIKKIVELPLIGLAIPLAIIFRLVNCFTPIRLTPIRANLIGHFVLDTEYYLRRQHIALENHRLFCFFGTDVSNVQWARMVCRRYRVNTIFRYIWAANRLFPGFDQYEKELIDRDFDTRDAEGILDRTRPEIIFTPEEVLLGEKYLREIGLEKEDKFVCVLVRDSAYRESLMDGIDRTYHSYRDSEVSKFTDAAVWLADKGYWVIRMGKVVKELFRVENSRVVDYANSKDRSDYLDIWLMANCYFCISTGTGLDEVAGMAGRPTVFVNLLPLAHITLHKNCITVPKKLIWKKSRELLSLKDYMRNSYMSTDEYVEQGIEIQSLSSFEIKEVVVEMEEMIKGDNVLNHDQKSRQEKSFQIILECDKLNTRQYQFYRNANARIGTGFLERYWSQLCQ